MEEPKRRLMVGEELLTGADGESSWKKLEMKEPQVRKMTETHPIATTVNTVYNSHLKEVKSVIGVVFSVAIGRGVLTVASRNL